MSVLHVYLVAVLAVYNFALWSQASEPLLSSVTHFL